LARPLHFTVVDKEGNMDKANIWIKVEYDPQNRTFRLVDSEFNTLLEGDGLYDLRLPVVMYEEADIEDWITASSSAVAHA
jgi:hypothetical protein